MRAKRLRRTIQFGRATTGQEVPPKVEYSLTEMGRSLEPLLRFMSEWGHANRTLMVAGIESVARATMEEAPTSVLGSATPTRSAVHLR